MINRRTASIQLPRFFRFENLKMPVFSKNFIVIILLAFVFIPSSFDNDLNAISLNAIIPVLFFYSLYKSPYLLGKYRFFRLLLLLIFWMMLSGFAAVDSELFWNEIRKMLGGAMFIFILIRFCRTEYRYIYYFYLLYIIKFIYIFYYAYEKGLLTVDISSERFNLDDLNANVFGYFGFFAMAAAFLLTTYTQKLQKSFYSVLFYIIFGLTVTAGVFAASRATLLISVAAFGLLLMIRYLYPINRRSVIAIVLIVISVIAVSKTLDETFDKSYVKGRFENKEDDRYDLLSRAFDVGKQNFVLGVGSGNFVLYNPTKQFSHNSFAELWANNGIVALLIFLFILGEAFRKIREYNRLGGSKKNSLFFIVICATYCIYNLFYVFYINFFMLAFIFLIMMHLEHLKRIRMLVKKNQLTT